MNARKHPALCFALALLLIGAVAPGAAKASFGVGDFSTAALNRDGSVDLQAGSHPYEYKTSFTMTQDSGGKGEDTLRDLIIDLPPGLIGNPLAVPRCKGANFEGSSPSCPGNTQIGVAVVRLEGLPIATEAIYNLAPPVGVPASFGLSVIEKNGFLEGAIRTGGDYGISVSDITLPTSPKILSVTATIWGVPADPGHDALRQCVNPQGGHAVGCPSGTFPSPFLTLPTSCTGPLTTTISVDSVENPGDLATRSGFVSKNTQSANDAGIASGLNNCEKLPFDPEINAQLETTAPDSPTGLHVNLRVPQHEEVRPLEGELPAADEVQSLTVEVSNGQFALGFEGKNTGLLPFNASAIEVQGALQALSSIGAGNVLVSGGPGGSVTTPFVVKFTGALSHRAIPPLEVLLKSTGGKAFVTTVVEGRPPGERGVIGSEADLATAHLKDAVVTLPKGIVLNPSSGNGLGACSSVQADLHSSGPADCPDNSKVGTVKIETPALDHPILGSVYLAKQGDNPFNSLLALYIAVDDPLSGVIVKLAGKVEPDPVTGQLRTTFKDNPQLPFENLDFDFFGGPRAPLTTPPTCGKYTTTADLTPWSSPEGEDAHLSDSFQVGGSCPATEVQMPNKPVREAGTAAPLAGSYSPFVLKISRENGSQRMQAVNVVLPPGLVGKLAGVQECSEAQIAVATAHKNPGEGAMEQASPSCPAASEIGTVTAGAGSGTPLYVSGRAYLAGPYKGAPLSLAVITPAIAGPFDLGTIVVRAGLYVNPETAQITAKSDPIPTILQGIPLDVRSIAVDVSRPKFMLNPTSCDPMSIGGDVVSTLGQSAPLANRFQVGGCKGLDFAPKFSLRLKGGVKRGAYPALRAEFKAKPGEANSRKISVALPHSEFLAQNHIRTICTRVQFAAHSCPKGSIYGKVTAFTPLLDKPLRGHVYLRSSSHPLPDLVLELNGQVDAVIVGRVDSVNGGIRNTFAAAPDVPVSKVILEMQGGKKGLFVNSRNICRTTNRATVKLDAHNGKIHDFNPPLQVSCKHKKKK